MKKVLAIIVLLAFAAVTYLANEGLFSKVLVTEGEMPGFRVMGIEHRGPYEKIGPAFERMSAIAKEKGIEPRMIGVYFDNPDMVAEDSLKSLAGMIVSAEDSLVLASLPELKSLIIPAGHAAISSFETDGMASMIIGAMKSYPKLTEYVAEKNRGEDVNFVYEVYGEGQTQYVMQFRD
jgi:DNA gyrase inhibitor GyrI